MPKQIKIKTTESKQLQTTLTTDTRTIKLIGKTIVAISKKTDITTMAIQQTSNKTETTQTNTHVDILTEQITSPGVVKPVLTAEVWDTCLANVEHHNRIRIVAEIQTQTKTIKTCGITTATTTLTPHSNEIF